MCEEKTHAHKCRQDGSRHFGEGQTDDCALRRQTAPRKILGAAATKYFQQHRAMSTAGDGRMGQDEKLNVRRRVARQH